jgi:hypothetical protein
VIATLLALAIAAWAEPPGEAALLARVAERDPAYHERLLALRERDPAAYAVQLARVARIAERYDEDPAFAARVDQIRDLETEFHAIAERWRAASPADRPRLAVEMRAVATQVFELKQAERRQRIAEFQAQLVRLESEVSALEAERDAIIERWMRSEAREE